MRLSGRTIAVKAVPTDLPPSEVRNLLAEILDSFDSHKRGNARETLRDDIAASLGLQSRRQSQYEINAGKNAVAD